MNPKEIREAATEYAEGNIGGEIAKGWFVEGAEWLASKLPSLEEISRALYDTWNNDYMIDEVKYMTPIARNMLADSIPTLIEKKVSDEKL